jgi:hypothetical protein
LDQSSGTSGSAVISGGLVRHKTIMDAEFTPWILRLHRPLNFSTGSIQDNTSLS